MNLNSIINLTATTVLIAVGWIISFLGNEKFFIFFHQHQFVSWVFLPAGLRLVLVIIFRLKAVPGLLLGSLYLCKVQMGMTFLNALILSLIASTIVPFVTLYASSFLNFDQNFSGLNLKKLMYLSFITSFSSSLIHNLYFDLVGVTDFIAVNLWGMFVGDFIGTILILYIILFVLRTIEKIKAV